MKFNLDYFRKNKPFKYLIIFSILFLMGFLTLFASKDIIEEKQKESISYRDDSLENIESRIQSKRLSYTEEIEERLKEKLSKIDGAGNLEVLLTLDNNGEIILNKDIPSSSNTRTEEDTSGGGLKYEEKEVRESTVIVRRSDGSEEPIIIKEIMPEVKGVLIIAEGADDSTVKTDLIHAVKVLLDLPVHKIEVVKMKSK